VTGRGAESVRRGPRESKPGATEDVSMKVLMYFQPSNELFHMLYSSYDFVGHTYQGQKGTTTAQRNGVTAFTVDTRRLNPDNSLSHCSSMVHPSAVGGSWTRKAKNDDGHLDSSKVHQSSRNGPDKSISMAQGGIDLYRKDDWATGKDNVSIL